MMRLVPPDYPTRAGEQDGMATGLRQPRRQQTLAEMLDEATGEHSQVQLAAAAGYRGKQGIGYLLSAEMKQFPAPERLQNLARVLRRPVADVVLATARQLGMEVETIPSFTYRLPVGVDGLGEVDQVELVKLIEAFVKNRSEAP